MSIQFLVTFSKERPGNGNKLASYVGCRRPNLQEHTVGIHSCIHEIAEDQDLPTFDAINDYISVI